MTFSGLVEHVGTVKRIDELDASTSGGGGWSVTINDARTVLDDCKLGDSICVNGACLTVTEFDEDSFKVGLAPETLKRTDLGMSIVAMISIHMTDTRTRPGNLKEGSKVNLERALQVGARYGGHFVQVISYFRRRFQRLMYSCTHRDMWIQLLLSWSEYPTATLYASCFRCRP